MLFVNWNGQKFEMFTDFFIEIFLYSKIIFEALSVSKVALYSIVHILKNRFTEETRE